MCGIAGILRSDACKLKLTEDIISRILISLEYRGHDATGLCWKDKNNKVFYILKTSATATDFVNLPEYKKNIPQIVKSSVILLHTRAASQGSPLFNHNNHPIFNKMGIIIHNGDTHVPEWLPSDGTTDSEQIMLYIQKYGWDGLSKIVGWLSIAYISLSTDEIFIYRDNAPLSYSTRIDDAFLFASTRQTLTDSFGITEEISNIKPHIVFKVDNTFKLLPVLEIKKPVIQNEIGVHNYGYTTIYPGYSGSYSGEQFWDY